MANAAPPTTKKQKKSVPGELSKPAQPQENGSDDPPQHVDPAMLSAIAEAPQLTLFGSSTTPMPYVNTLWALPATPKTPATRGRKKS